MRWAEFKTVVLISVAGRLTRWADFVERRIDYRELPPARVVDDNEELAGSLHDGELPSDVPEHWARLVARRPPRAWINLIKERAPDLLSKTESELLSDEGRVQEVFEKELLATENRLSEDSPVERSQPETRGRETRRNELHLPAAKTRKATWLNRLRFRPPASSSSTSPTAYITDSETGQPGLSDAPVQESSAPRQERKTSSAQPRSRDGRVVERTLSLHPDQTDAASDRTFKLFRHSTKQTRAEHVVSKDRSEPRHHERMKDLEPKAAPEEPQRSPSLRFPDSNGRSSAAGLQHADVAQRTRNVTPASSLRLRPDTRRTQAADEINFHTGENIWPSLPVAHDDSELADELAAMQRDAERVRRLELEQRGALWNA